jgi:hypothetical protein
MKEEAKALETTKLEQLYAEFGQSPWIDNIRRDWLNDGTLAGLVEQGVRGVTSNPSIFQKSLATSSAYDEQLEGKRDLDPEVLFEEIAVRDVRDACDVLAEVNTLSIAQFAGGARRYCDGFVSLEVSPGARHRGDRYGRQASRRRGGTTQRHDQDPRHEGRPSGDHGSLGRGHQRERDTHLLARALQRSHYGVDGGFGARAHASK